MCSTYNGKITITPFCHLISCNIHKISQISDWISTWWLPRYVCACYWLSSRWNLACKLMQLLLLWFVKQRIHWLLKSFYARAFTTNSQTQPLYFQIHVIALPCVALTDFIVVIGHLLHSNFIGVYNIVQYIY